MTSTSWQLGSDRRRLSTVTYRLGAGVDPVRPVIAVLAVLGASALTAGVACAATPSTASTGRRRPGQTSYQLAGHGVVSSAAQTPVPIASLAKVMTAYLVLRDHPLGDGDGDLDLPVTDADVEDTDRRAGQDESVVEVAAGETLTERQALAALLLPSANNVAR